MPYQAWKSLKKLPLLYEAHGWALLKIPNIKVNKAHTDTFKVFSLTKPNDST